MIRSMTGFAGAEEQHGFGRLGWELRSVNHRYLEINYRAPEEFRSLESDVRKILGDYLGRGKVDATLRFTPSSEASSANLALNDKLLNRLLEIHQEMESVAGTGQQPNLLSLMRWPGVIEEKATDPKPMQEAALALLHEAAEGLCRARGREGEQMAAAITERVDAIESQVAQVREWLPEIREGLRTRLLTRVEDLQQPLEPGRLEQEVAFLAQKIDVDEELDRLAAHVQETRRVLERDEPVGRRLDFLMQEFNRESNTLSSKSIDGRTTQASVDLKVYIEQMREQVQNIE